MQLPQALLSSLQSAKGFNQDSFIALHNEAKQVISIRVNPLKSFAVNDFLPIENNVPWSQYSYYLSERPSFTADPFFHAGCYYVQEASSMFLEQALKQSIDTTQPLKVLDLCAAPGGKSTHIQSLLTQESLLVSNEVIRNRASVLKENIIKWGGANVAVTHNDPKDFATLENYFDVIVIDAPCSGSGMFRKDADAIQEWSEANVQLCSQRQQRIIADVWPALKQNGVLIYSTCSYSQEEDEAIAQWIKDEFTAKEIKLNIPGEWNITETSSGYRFWPDKIQGEGFYLAAFQKTDGGVYANTSVKKKITTVSKNDKNFIVDWMATEGYAFVSFGERLYAWHENLINDFSFLAENLRVIYSGTETGTLMKNKLVPAHALSMNGVIDVKADKVALGSAQALRFLQRKDLPADIGSIGWKLATYKDKPLGWVNVLSNRVNNYYPAAWRILKEF